MPAKKCWFCNKNNDPNASFCVKCGTPFDWIDKEPGERVRILFKTANKGYSLAQYNLGVYYEAGVGVPQNYEEAARWYLKSAKQGDADAQASLGQCYQFGKGVPLDYEEAAKWYRKAAEQGVAVAQKNLGQLYDSGQGVPKDYTEAVKWYLKAAKQGNAIAQTNLGYAYHRGEGITQDYEEAVKWYRKAIEQGQSAAQNNLGVMYRDGQGVSQDFEEAARLFQKSAEQGDETAKKNLSRKINAIFLILLLMTITLMVSCSKAPGTDDVEDDVKALNYRIANKTEGAGLMLSNDAYFDGMTQNDLDFRTQKTGATSDEYKTFAGEQVLDFTDEQKAIIDKHMEHHNSFATFVINDKNIDCFTAFVTTRHFEKEGDNFFDLGTTALVPVDGTDIFYTPEDAGNFDEVFGKNTDYVIDPEECLADNFGFLFAYGMEGPEGDGYPDPEILSSIEDTLKKS